MRFNKYLPFVLVYFFLNAAGLPFGLTYMALLSPLFYLWILLVRKKEVLLPFLTVMFLWFLMHFINGVDTRTYLISFGNIVAVYIFGQTVYTFLKKGQDIEKLFRIILVINFFLCLISIPAYFSSFKDYLWIKQFLTEGIDNFYRLKLFTYEASYYATLFIPVFFFFFMQLVLSQNTLKAVLLIPMLLLPYLLSFSLGVISGILLAIGVTYLIYFERLTRKKRVLISLAGSGAILLFVLIVALTAFPDNPLFVRIENIFSGNDSSGRGRTSEAFVLAGKMLEKKSHLWGIGLGQIKILGAPIIQNFYLYPLDYQVFAIPNATAETLALFGWIGLIFRLTIQFFLFFYTKVWRNYYRLLLFIFVFIYQFTGSFITNIAEYVIWILAFTEVFPQFQVHSNLKITQSDTRSF